MHRRCSVPLVVGLACVLPAALAVGAAAQNGSRQSAALRFVEQRPGVPSAVTFDIDYVNPDDPSAKPPAVRKVVSDFAEGTHINTSVPEQCTATDAQLMLQGATACPAGSKVGGGFVRIDTGFAGDARFLNEDVTLLNNEDEVIFLFTDRAGGARVVNRAVVEGSRTTTTAPPLPGTPPDGGAVDVVQLHLDEISRSVGGDELGYISTPRECPDSG